MNNISREGMSFCSLSIVHVYVTGFRRYTKYYDEI